VIRSSVDDWSMMRSLALVAAMFAIVFGSLIPFAAQAAAQPGQSVIICSAQGPQTVQLGADDMDGPAGQRMAAKCAACVMPLVAALPAPVVGPVIAHDLSTEAVGHPLVQADAPPPARAPPRPHSTAPPVFV
jgi:hypothetical protein